MEDSVIIFDTTLRDGEQAPGFSMTVDQKIQMAVQLERLGVDVIEAGFPVASRGDFESVREIAGAVKKSTIAARNSSGIMETSGIGPVTPGSASEMRRAINCCLLTSGAVE